LITKPFHASAEMAMPFNYYHHYWLEMFVREGLTQYLNLLQGCPKFMDGGVHK
jgi:hypothetical protein